MGVDQSPVSRRLAALTESVGADLVILGGRKFALTPEGRILQAAAERMEAIVTEASLVLRTAKDDVAGTVRMSCPPGFVVLLLQALKTARETYPGLRCQVNGDYRTVDLAKGESDLALRAFRPTELDLVARKLVEIGWFVYASTSYREARGLPRTFDELASHALVLYTPPMHTVSALKWMEEHKGHATEIARVDNIELAAQVIASGEGIGVLPGFVAEANAGLVRVFEESVAITTMYCVYHESARDTARVRAAVDALTSYFEANASALFDGSFVT